MKDKANSNGGQSKGDGTMYQKEAIKQAGIMAGKAAKNGDVSASKWHSDWAKKAIQLTEDPKEAEKLFLESYRQGSGFYTNN